MVGLRSCSDVHFYGPKIDKTARLSENGPTPALAAQPGDSFLATARDPEIYQTRAEARTNKIPFNRPAGLVVRAAVFRRPWMSMIGIVSDLGFRCVLRPNNFVLLVRPEELGRRERPVHKERGRERIVVFCGPFGHAVVVAFWLAAVLVRERRGGGLR